MKKQPFVVGDTAYHPGLGKVRIMSIERDGLDIQVKQADYMVPQWTNASLLSFEPWPEPGYLSFEPWPAPVHKRPMKDGYYLVSFKDYNRTCLAQFKADAAPLQWQLIGPSGKRVEDHTAGNVHIKPLAYLGTELQWWQS